MSEIALEPLPCAENALEPVISAKTLSFHYGKHHAGYLATLKKLIAVAPTTWRPSSTSSPTGSSRRRTSHGPDSEIP